MTPLLWERRRSTAAAAQSALPYASPSRRRTGPCCTPATPAPGTPPQRASGRTSPSLWSHYRRRGPMPHRHPSRCPTCHCLQHQCAPPAARTSPGTPASGSRPAPPRARPPPARTARPRARTPRAPPSAHARAAPRMSALPTARAAAPACCRSSPQCPASPPRPGPRTATRRTPPPGGCTGSAGAGRPPAAP